MKWYDGLSDEQRKAASHIGNHLRLLAGPGTGKTKVLTRHVLYLIQEKGEYPSSIVALTFTRAAAAQLRREVHEALRGEMDNEPHVSTIHSYALTQLLRNPQCCGLPEPLRIADDYEERHIIIEDMKTLLRANVTEVRTMIKSMAAKWDNLEEPSKSEFLGAWKEHRDVYGYTLRDELVYRFWLALKQGKLERWDVPKYLLIDEYQDLNPCELSVVEQLISLGTEAYVVGDDDQSIFGFRHATPKGIREFCESYNSDDQSLELCWRCGPKVLDLASYVIRQDYERVEKNLKACPNVPTGEHCVLMFGNQQEEATGIADLCEWLIKVQGLPMDDIMILLRSDSQKAFSKPIVAALNQRGLTVGDISNPLAPLDSKEGRVFIALLRLAVNNRDHLAWRTILSLQPNNLGDVTLQALYERLKSEGLTLYEAIEHIEKDPDWAPTKGYILQKEIKKIRSLILEIIVPEGQSMVDRLHDIAFRYMKDATVRNDVLKLLDRVAIATNPKNLGELLRDLNTVLGTAEQERDADAISLMTMHQAKGLTARAVIIAAAEDEQIPDGNKGAKKAEERRLLYVSLTRAKEYMFLTYCTRRYGAQQHKGSSAHSSKRRLTSFLEDFVDVIPGSQYLSNLKIH